ncbi:hypothetical protein Pyn_11074 [Prunus yedoensis var. nudiflora]|uniref:Uncharacterized protein n=1 Tax=Prunus yedoensis var. nudiflora TaxID=2094558 RepID=A0A314Z4W1_PRUYE|nr:hypothetical protein Pyn_11074 [Prunus yedoensis var. nudiflora]
MHDAPETIEERLLAFTGLDLSEDLKGRQLRMMGHKSSETLASDTLLTKAGSNSCWRRHLPHQQPSDTGRGQQVNKDNWRSGKGGAEREEEARLRQMWEAAWELGLLGQGASVQQKENLRDTRMHNGSSNSSILGEAFQCSEKMGALLI